MSPSPAPDREAQRIAALRGYGLLDTAPDPAFDAFAQLAAAICDTPIALVSLVDTSRQWFKANVGLPQSSETPREVAFCAHAIEGDALFNVEDTLEDDRFRENPLVTGDPNLRFYAGMPLIDSSGFALGTLCVLDRKPRALTEIQQTSLAQLATSLVAAIEARKDESPEQLARMDVLNRALELAPAPMMVLRAVPGDTVALMVYANPAFAELFGYNVADMIGRAPRILHGPKTDRVKMERLRVAAFAREAGSETVFLYTATGETRLVEVRNRQIDETHQICSVRDLTRIHAAHEALSESNHRLQSLLANNTDAVLTLDGAGMCTDANSAAIAMFGIDRAALLGRGYFALAPDGIFSHLERFPAALIEGRTMEFSTTMLDAAGRTLRVDCKAVPMIVHGATEGAYLMVADVTLATRLAGRVADQARRLHALLLISSAAGTTNFEQVDAALMLALDALDMQYGYVGRIDGDELFLEHTIGVHVFNAGDRIELSRTYVSDTLAHGDALAVSDLAQQPIHSSQGTERRTYDQWHGYISAPLLVDGETYGAIGFLSNKIIAFDEIDLDFIRLVAVLISTALERERRANRLDRLAFYDTLTGIPNRGNFLAQLERAFRDTAGGAPPFAVHFIDLDGFKTINDSFGHAGGDVVLQAVAQRLHDALRDDDAMPARLGGDEFVVLQRGVASADDARRLAEHVLSVLCAPFAFADGARATISASIGVALAPQDGSDVRELLGAADRAVYRAKAAGKRRIEAAQ